jgi:hypothetical protein
MNKKELDKTLKLHEKWLEDSSKGGRANLREANLKGANLKGADLREADLRGANLKGANLKGANLREANLKGANLREANLREANLWGADLWRADLKGAVDLPKVHQNALCLLHSQKHPLTSYKYLAKDMLSPYRDFEYKIGETYKEQFPSESAYDLREKCYNKKAIHLATLQWCLIDTNSKIDNYIYVECEFKPEHLLPISYNCDGKFQVTEMKVIRKLTRKELEEAISHFYPSEIKE